MRLPGYAVVQSPLSQDPATDSEVAVTFYCCVNLRLSLREETSQWPIHWCQPPPLESCHRASAVLSYRVHCLLGQYMSCHHNALHSVQHESLVHRAIYNQTLVNNWTVQGYNTIIYPNASDLDSGELITQCAMMAPSGSLTFTAPGPSFFLGKLSITFWAQYATGSRDLQLTLASSDDPLPQVHICHGKYPVLVPTTMIYAYRPVSTSN